MVLRPTVFSDAEAMSAAAVVRIRERLQTKPSTLLCLAAGGTPTRTYELLADLGKREPDLFAHARAVQLDEWGGLGATHPSSCQRQLRAQLVDALQLGDRFLAFDGTSVDPTAECARVAARLAEEGPIDVCILGLGLNGHLGFNEPAAELAPRAHATPLSATSQQHDMVRGGDAAPSYGLTLGMADLLESREILLLVSGAKKCAALKRLLSGSVTAEFPASYLSQHRHVEIFCDAAAMAAT